MFNLPTLTQDLLKELLRWIRWAIRSYQEYWKVPEAINPDYEIPIALLSFWRERRDCCGLYGYQSDPGLLIALKQPWCALDVLIINNTLQKKPLSLQHLILPYLSWMFFSTSCSCLLRKIKVWAPVRGKSAGIWQFAALDPACGFTVSGQAVRGTELGLLQESEMPAPHWMLLLKLTEAGLLENAEPANQVSKANRFTYIRTLITSYQVMLAETLSSV